MDSCECFGAGQGIPAFVFDSSVPTCVPHGPSILCEIQSVVFESSKELTYRLVNLLERGVINPDMDSYKELQIWPSGALYDDFPIRPPPLGHVPPPAESASFMMNSHSGEMCRSRLDKEHIFTTHEMKSRSTMAALIRDRHRKRIGDQKKTNHERVRSSTKSDPRAVVEATGGFASSVSKIATDETVVTADVDEPSHPTSIGSVDDTPTRAPTKAVKWSNNMLSDTISSVSSSVNSREEATKEHLGMMQDELRDCWKGDGEKFFRILLETDATMTFLVDNIEYRAPNSGSGNLVQQTGKRLYSTGARMSRYQRDNVMRRVKSINFNDHDSDRMESPQCMLHPLGPTRMAWNIITILLMLLDILVIPLVVFNIEQNEFLDWATATFWTIDMMVTFRTGVFKDTQLEMRPGKIAQEYARSWLPFDTFIVTFEWISRCFQSFFADASIARTLRSLRVLRLVKLLRIAKMREILKEMIERINNPLCHLLWTLLKLICLLNVAVHYFACLWYLIGNSQDDGWKSYDNYVQRSNGNVTFECGSESVQGDKLERDCKLAVDRGCDSVPGDERDDPGVFFWYVASARWVISQLNGRTDMDERRNMVERCFTAVFGVLLAIVFQAVFVALVTKTMLDLNEMFKERTQRQRMLNEYLGRYALPHSLVRFVQLHVRDYLDVCKQKQKESHIMSLMPSHLQTTLMYETRKRFITAHSFFRTIADSGKPAFSHICRYAMNPLYMVKLEMIFDIGDPCNRMLFTDTGIASYSLRGRCQAWAGDDSVELMDDMKGDTLRDALHVGRLRSSLTMLSDPIRASMKSHLTVGPDGQVTKVGHGSWLCEAALWMSWTNRGMLTADCTSSMMEVNATGFAEALRKQEDVFAKAVIYGMQYVGQIKKNSFTDLREFDIYLEGS